jgi:AbrB family looped-hinge helix DNA binding protein
MVSISSVFGMLQLEVRIPDFRKSGIYLMNTSARIQTKGQVTIPTSVRRQAGLSKGDLVDFAFQRGKIVITPKVVIDRSQFPNADDEYTPAQRRSIDARLEAAATEVRKGNVSASFDNITDFAASLKTRAKKLSTNPKRSGRR